MKRLQPTRPQTAGKNTTNLKPAPPLIKTILAKTDGRAPTRPSEKKCIGGCVCCLLRTIPERTARPTTGAQHSGRFRRLNAKSDESPARPRNHVPDRSPPRDRTQGEAPEGAAETAPRRSRRKAQEEKSSGGGPHPPSHRCSPCIRHAPSRTLRHRAQPKRLPHVQPASGKTPDDERSRSSRTNASIRSAFRRPSRRTIRRRPPKEASKSNSENHGIQASWRTSPRCPLQGIIAEVHVKLDQDPLPNVTDVPFRIRNTLKTR